MRRARFLVRTLCAVETGEESKVREPYFSALCHGQRQKRDAGYKGRRRRREDLGNQERHRAEKDGTWHCEGGFGRGKKRGQEAQLKR